MEARQYKFKEKEQAQAAHEEIVINVGPISQLSGKTVTLGGPAGALSVAAQTCERHGGSLKRFLAWV